MIDHYRKARNSYVKYNPEQILDYFATQVWSQSILLESWTKHVFTGTNVDAFVWTWSCTSVYTKFILFHSRQGSYSFKIVYCKSYKVYLLFNQRYLYISSNKLHSSKASAKH